MRRAKDEFPVFHPHLPVFALGFAPLSQQRVGGEVVRDAVVASAVAAAATAAAAAAVVPPLAALAGVAAQESDVDLRRGKEKQNESHVIHETSKVDQISEKVVTVEIY